DTHVLSLRKKIETDPRQPSLIQTVRNIGYRFNPDFLKEIQPASPMPSVIAHPNGNGNQPSKIVAHNS
ncbi:MAG: winged helix-turn-helix domain-containing protein, partial [Microcystaceae cyanobacterium]